MRTLAWSLVALAALASFPFQPVFAAPLNGWPGGAAYRSHIVPAQFDPWSTMGIFVNRPTEPGAEWVGRRQGVRPSHGSGIQHGPKRLRSPQGHLVEEAGTATVHPGVGVILGPHPSQSWRSGSGNAGPGFGGSHRTGGMRHSR